MPKLALATCLSIAALAAAVPAANAAVIPGQTLDGPTNDIVQFGDLDMAPDGSAALVYLKDTGQNQVFVARRVGGVWQAPQAITNGAADQGLPQVEVGNGGRVVVSYLDIADLKAKVSPAAGQPFSPEVPIEANAAGYDFAMNASGVGYFAVRKGGNILARRLVGTTSTPLASAIDNVPGNNNAGNTDVAVAVDGAGNAVAAWDEPSGGNTGIWTRRLTGTTPGPALEATVPSLLGAARSNGAQNVDVESDDAGNAWVAFREQFTYANARNRPLVRRLAAGGTFGPAFLLDPGPTPPPDMTDAEFTRLAVTPAGDQAIASGFIQNNNTAKPPVFGAALTPGGASPFLLEPNPSDQAVRTTNAIVPGGSALIAYSFKPSPTADFDLRGRIRDGTGQFAASTPLSNPALGPVDTTLSPVAGSDNGNTAVVGYLQGAAANKRILVATIDLPKPAGGGVANVRPVVSKLKLSRTTFRKGRKLPKASARRYKTGTTISFRLSEKAKVRLSFEAIKKGRKVGKRCKPPTRKNRNRRSCKRYVKVKTAITITGKAGANKVSFQGRITRRKSLKVGRYRLTLVATDSAGLKSKAVRKNFRLLAAAKKRKR